MAPMLTEHPETTIMHESMHDYRVCGLLPSVQARVEGGSR
jgi:hypothetical protein